MEEKKVSKSVLKRLPGYLAYLKNMPENSPAHISATALANALGMGEVQVGDELEIFGRVHPVEELARLAGTISYELTCAVSKRVPRVYLQNGREVEKELLLRF